MREFHRQGHRVMWKKFLTQQSGIPPLSCGQLDSTGPAKGKLASQTLVIEWRKATQLPR